MRALVRLTLLASTLSACDPAPPAPPCPACESAAPAASASAPAPVPAPCAAPEPSGAPRAEALPIKLAFVGDVALNYSIATDVEALAAGKARPGLAAGFPFDGVAERLRAADLAAANLECVLSEKGEVSTWHKPFRCPLAGADAILAAGVDVVSVANNHSWDYGREGFFDMLKNLEAKRLPATGKGFRHEAPHEPERPVIFDVRGAKVGFLGYYFARDEELARDVRAARGEADVVIAFFHWGREKQSDVTPEQRRQARAAIDAGASLVVGSHVHVLQPTEVYRGRLIAYGLGNFVFMGMNHEERFRRGAILEVALTKDRLVSFELVPTRIDDKGAPRLVVPEPSYLPPAR